MDEHKTGRARLVFLFWIMVTFFYFYLAADYVRSEVRDNQFGEYVQFAVQLAGTQGRTDRELRQLVTAKARELQIPLDPVNVNVSGEGPSLNVRVEYGVNIVVPLLYETAFRKEYQHSIRYVAPR